MDKTRKEYDGPLRNKERTKIRLLNAVGEILTRDGYTGLRINKIVAQARVDRKTLYEYFGTVDNLIETYIRQKDYWTRLASKTSELLEIHKGDFARELAESILLNQLDFFYNDEEVQQIVRWQISEDNPAIFDICEERERLGVELFKLTDPFFEGTTIDIRALMALQIAGIYTMVLHAKKSRSLFCGIDLNSTDGMDRIKKAISKIVSLTYKEAENEKKH